MSNKDSLPDTGFVRLGASWRRLARFRFRFRFRADLQ